MKSTHKIAVTMAGMACFLALAGGCSGGAHTERQEFAINEVSSIQVDYDGESVTVREGGDKIALVENLNKSKKTYRAVVRLSGGVLTVTEGARPIGNGVHSTLELYLPKGYLGGVSLHTTDGQISCGALMLDSFHADTTNGSVEVSGLTAKQIGLTTTGGSLKLANATGAGRFEASGDGSVELAFSEVTGDITASAKNGNLLLTLPADLGFALTAQTKNGRIDTPFSAEDKTAATEVNGGGVKISLENKNGDIAVKVQ